METICQALVLLLTVMEYVLLARVILSWLPIQSDNRLVQMIYQLTEPILAPIRNIIEKSPVGNNTILDFSPLIAFLIIEFVRRIIRTYI